MSGKNTALVIAVLVVVLLAGAIVIKKSHRFSETPISTTPAQDIESSTSADTAISASPSATTSQSSPQ